MFHDEQNLLSVENLICFLFSTVGDGGGGGGLDVARHGSGVVEMWRTGVRWGGQIAGSCMYYVRSVLCCKLSRRQAGQVSHTQRSWLQDYYTKLNFFPTR